MTAGGKTYVGKNQIRSYFATVAGAFQSNNNWTAYTPAQRIRTHVDGDNATLYFECLYVDAPTKTIKTHTFSNDTLVRSGDRWLIKTMKAGAVDEI